MIEVVPLVSIKIAHIKDCLENIIPNQLNDLLTSYKKFAELYDIAAKRLDYEQKMKTFTNIDHSIVEPPNCITEMNIIPKLEDILTDQAPILRRNITNGAYNSVQHYLDVQFRLLREDYLNPLRDQNQNANIYSV